MMPSWWNSLLCVVSSTIRTMYSFIVDAFEIPLDFFMAVVNAALTLLPQDPRNMEGGIDSQILDTFNYVIPMQAIVAEFMAILLAWIFYRIAQWALAWGKADF